ncbi:MFS transporter, partial [Streptomyces sp. NPDC059083]|uniref:MFS transporter n=1 Tax=Streptomyces sp. NPDC059083 TaxID=3346721 RepID=UPI0036A06171
IMDTSIIGVALPELQGALGFSQGNLSWVFNAYVVVFGGLLLLGGKLSDIAGARRIFRIGWGVLGIGSLVAGLAGNAAVELIGRGVQGAGAALIAPSALTLLMMLFGSNPGELTKAFAVYGAAAPAGGTAGVFLGGLITQYASWPWVFYINIPIALAALLAAPALVPDGAMAPHASVDLLGAVTATLGLGAAVFGVVRADWAASSTWVVLFAAAVLLGAFVAIQARRKEPLMPLSIFRAPDLGAANLAQVLLGAAWVPMWFFLNLYLQQVLGYSAFPSGAALLPMTALIMVGMIAISPKLFARFGARTMTVAGLLLLAAGLVWLSFIRSDGNFWIDVLPGS